MNVLMVTGVALLGLGAFVAGIVVSGLGAFIVLNKRDVQLTQRGVAKSPSLARSSAPLLGPSLRR